MRRLACLALAASSISAPVMAQSGPPSPTALPSASDLASRDMVTVAVGGAFVPDYEGSDDYQAIPVGAIRATVHGISISTDGPYLTVDLIPQSTRFNFDAGPIAGLRLDGRRHTDDPVVRLMVRRNTAYEVGGFVGGSFHDLIDPYDSLSFQLQILHDLGNAHRSTVFRPSVSFSTPLSRKTYVSLSAGTSFVSSKFANYYFGVAPADVLATGGALPLYRPRGGMKDWKLSLLVDQSITGDLLHGISFFGLGQYSRLVGDFSRSPIVAERGSANQWIAAVGLAYTW